MDNVTKVNGKMANSTATDTTHGLTRHLIRAFSKTASNMEKASILQKISKSLKVFGSTADEMVKVGS